MLAKVTTKQLNKMVHDAKQKQEQYWRPLDLSNNETVWLIQYEILDPQFDPSTVFSSDCFSRVITRYSVPIAYL